MEHHISDWEQISNLFLEMFQNLGDVTITKKHLAFSSIKPHVVTSLMLTSDGQLVASMPLHTIDSHFNQVTFGDSLESIRLVGLAFDYTYVIPPELLQIRENY